MALVRSNLINTSPRNSPAKTNVTFSSRSTIVPFLLTTVMKKKPSLGRQKIPMEKIPKKNHRQVTFSKRRAGLFKKASELCTLCGVDIAIIVFSPAEKPFSFGHPEVESIIHRFPNRNPPLAPCQGSTNHFIEAQRNASVREFNLHLTSLGNQLESERKRGEALDKMLEATRGQCWWAAPVEKLGVSELEQLKAALEELKTNVARQVDLFSIDNLSQILGLDGTPNDQIYVPATTSAVELDPQNYCTFCF